MQYRVPFGGRRAAVAFCLAFLLHSGIWLYPVHATELITNGGFEAGGGSLTGWTEIPLSPATPFSSGGFFDFFVQSGTTTPLTGFPAPAPPEGTHAAMSDCPCSGAGVLFQNFVVPIGFNSATLSFEIAVLNRYFAFFSPPNLVFGPDDDNQQVRVDILVGNPSSEFSVSNADVLLNLFQTQPGDHSVGIFSPGSYLLQTTDLTSLLQAHEGETLQLRFAGANTGPYLEIGVDAVSLSIAVPEPASLVLLCTGLLGLVAIRRRRSKFSPRPE